MAWWQSMQSDPGGILAQAVDPQTKHKITGSNVPKTIFPLMVCDFILFSQDLDSFGDPLLVPRGFVESQ